MIQKLLQKVPLPLHDQLKKHLDNDGKDPFHAIKKHLNNGTRISRFAKNDIHNAFYTRDPILLAEHFTLNITPTFIKNVYTHVLKQEIPTDFIQIWEIIDIFKKHGNSYLTVHEMHSKCDQKGITNTKLVAVLAEKGIIHFHDPYLFLDEIYQDEQEILNFLSEDAVKNPFRNVSLKQQEKIWPEITKDQEAVFRYFQRPEISRVTAIHGGAGTGKTATMAAILSQQPAELADSVYCCSPTHKAKSVFSAMVNGFKPQYKVVQSLAYANQKTEPKVIIIDEASMVGPNIMAQILRKYPKAIYILIGDLAQLPTIGPGNIFHDFIRHSGAHTINITQTVRTSNPDIINACKVAKEAKDLDPNTIGPLLIPDLNTREDVIQKCVHLVLKDINNTKIVTYTNHDVDDINDRIADILFKSNEVTNQGALVVAKEPHPDGKYYRNETGVMNFINSRWHFTVDGTTEPVDVHEMTENFGLGYALTVHRAQGSGFNHCILAYFKGFYKPSSNFIYTAVSRAKEKLTVVPQKGVIPNGGDVDRKTTNDLFYE